VYSVTTKSAERWVSVERDRACDTKSRSGGAESSQDFCAIVHEGVRKNWGQYRGGYGERFGLERRQELGHVGGGEGEGLGKKSDDLERSIKGSIFQSTDGDCRFEE